MTLSEFVRPLSLEQRIALAQDAGTSWLHLRNMAFSGKACGPVLAMKIERATNGAVRRWDLRPHDWHLIWPEIVGTEHAPQPAASAAISA